MNTKKDNNKHKKNLKILKQNNNNYESRISFGIFNIKKKNLKEAKLNFEQAIEIDRSRYEAYLNLSNLYILLDNITDGINILEKFIQINKYNKHIINNLSVFYFKNSQYEDLDKLLSQFIKKDKNHILLYLKANLFLKKNKIQKAIELFKKSLNINKNYWAAYEDLLASLEKLNQLKDLEKYILEAKINFLHEIKLYYYESLYLFRIKDYNRSLKIIFKNNLDKKFKNDMYLVNVLDLLSKNFEKLKNFEKSFYYALQRNKILLQLDDNKKYNKKIILETITVYKIFFKKKNFNKFTLSSDFISHNNLIQS